MNTNLRNGLFFALGATIGSLVTWRLTDVKYRRIAMEEIDEIRAYYADKEEHNKILLTQKYKTLDEVCGYSVNADTYEETKSDQDIPLDLDELESFDEFDEEGEGDDSGPHVISPAEFAEVDDYDAVSLTYYRDGVLADDWGDIIENADELVGSDFASQFGKYEDDTVYVRNNERKTDYEINRDLRTYASANERPPHTVDD